MNINILREYLLRCRTVGITPAFGGLVRFADGLRTNPDYQDWFLNPTTSENEVRVGVQ